MQLICVSGTPHHCSHQYLGLVYYSEPGAICCASSAFAAMGVLQVAS